MGVISSPVQLTDEQDVSEFDCGDETLNEWLVKRALKNQRTGGSRTFVVCDNNKVVGYYALASGSIERAEAPKNIARNMPQPIPAMVLARLAIDISWQGKKVGSSLLKDALLRVLAVSKNVGVRVVLVHAISEEAKIFYQRYGFLDSPIDPMTLMLPISHIEQQL